MRPVSGLAIENLFDICNLGMNATARSSFHKYLKSLVYTLNHHAKLYQRLWISPGKAPTLTSNERFASNALWILCVIDNS